MVGITSYLDVGFRMVADLAGERDARMQLGASFQVGGWFEGGGGVGGGGGGGG